MRGKPFWTLPGHRIPTLGLYRHLLKTCRQLPSSCVNQPGPHRQPIQGKKTGPPMSSAPLPTIKRSFLFAWIRDHFRSRRHCTSPRITRGYLLEAEEALEKLLKAKEGDEGVRKELEDMVQGRTGRLRRVIDHLNELITWEPGTTTQKDRYFRLKRAQELVWDIRPQSSIQKDGLGNPYSSNPASRSRSASKRKYDYNPNLIYYRIPLKPFLFEFPTELDYYPPHKYPNQLVNQPGKFKNFGGVHLTEVTTAQGSKFPRIRGGTQPTWLSMMLKHRVKGTVKRVDQWKELEEWKRMMVLEETMWEELGVEDKGYVETLDRRLHEVKQDHFNRKLVPSPSDSSLVDSKSE